MTRTRHKIIVGLFLSLCLSAFAWAGKKPDPGPPVTPPPFQQPDQPAPTTVNAHGEGGDAHSQSNAAAAAGAAAVVGDTSAVGLGGQGGHGGAGGSGGEGGHALAGGGSAAAQGGVGLGGTASQGQAQGIASSGNSASTSHGGTAQSAGGDAASVARSEGSSSTSGGNSIAVDASSRHHTLFIPSVTQGIAPSIVPGANVTAQASTVCGPRQEVISEPVSGTFHGLFVHRNVNQGTTDSLRPAAEAFRVVAYPDGSSRYYGHQVTTYVAAVGVSGARSLALGGGGGRGDWGQGSLGTSSANQRLVIKHVLSECELGASSPVITYVEARAPRG